MATNEAPAATRDTVLRALRHTRQVRSFTDEPVSDADLHAILEVCRWTGSSTNSQQWQFIVIRDADLRRRIGEISVHARYVGKAPLAIAIAMPGEDRETDAYDEGRVAERILFAAGVMDLGAGIAWRDATGLRADDRVDRASDGAGTPPADRSRHRPPAARGIRPRALTLRSIGTQAGSVYATPLATHARGDDLRMPPRSWTTR
jgi:nitroreductase